MGADRVEEGGDPHSHRDASGDQHTIGKDQSPASVDLPSLLGEDGDPEEEEADSASGNVGGDEDVEEAHISKMGCSLNP